jgi:hypothetical protein
MADCIREPSLWDRVLPIGGPGEALSALQQGEMLFDVLGQKPRFIQVPVALFDAIIGVLDFLAGIFEGMKDTAEFGRIGKYYAVESMLVLNPETGRYDAESTPSYGNDTLRYAVVAENCCARTLLSRKSHLSLQIFFRESRPRRDGRSGVGRRRSAGPEVSSTCVIFIDS